MADTRIISCQLQDTRIISLMNSLITRRLTERESRVFRQCQTGRLLIDTGVSRKDREARVDARKSSKRLKVAKATVCR